MASRSAIVTSIRRMLATSSDDPEFTDTILNPIVQEAVDSLVTDINVQNPGYNSRAKTVTSSTRQYFFATQTVPITDFASWLEVRWTDSNGQALHEVRYDELKDAGADCFTVTGIDSAAIIVTSSDSQEGKDIWMRYTVWPAQLAADGDVPGGIPLRFHDVIALEALYAFALGGEARTPPHLYQRWQDRRGQLIHHVGQRGVQPSTTRIYGSAL